MRSTLLCSVFVSFLFLPACSGEGAGGGDAAATGGKAPAPAPVAADMDAAIAALDKKPEHSADSVEVEHVLIAFQGAPRITGVTRSKDEAKQLAEKVYERAMKGEDFSALRREFSNDSGPGIYPMTKASRGQMVPAFGNVAWRLQVGEIGVAPHDAQKSPFGWHIIKRLK